MPAAQTAKQPSAAAPSFESVWAMIQELTASQKETARQMEETDRAIKETTRGIEELKESQKKTARLQKETARLQEETALQMKETDRQMKEYNKRFGEFTNRFGEVVEYMIAPNLLQKFRELGFIFIKATNNAHYDDQENDINFEVDVMLENGDKAMLVEVKTRYSTDDVNDHIERLEKMRKYADIRGDKRSFLGAVASVVLTPNVKNYALKKGFFVVEPSGETFFITPPKNKPREW